MKGGTVTQDKIIKEYYKRVGPVRAAREALSGNINVKALNEAVFVFNGKNKGESLTRRRKMGRPVGWRRASRKSNNGTRRRR